MKPLRQMEKAYILEVLELNGGNQTRTAEQLEIGSATLYRKLKRYGVIGGRPAIRKGPQRRERMNRDESARPCETSVVPRATHLKWLGATTTCLACLVNL